MTSKQEPTYRAMFMSNRILRKTELLLKVTGELKRTAQVLITGQRTAISIHTRVSEGRKRAGNNSYLNGARKRRILSELRV